RANTLQIELTTQAFRLTGDPSNLVERDAAIADRETSLAQIGEFVRDHPQQHDRWLALRDVIHERLAISRRVEELRKTEGEAAANAYVATAPLRSTRERVYQLLGDMVVTERSRVTRQEAAHEQARQLLVTSGVLAALALT
ncbi:CHASE3 domain-containing protein, partial [Leptospira sp. SA-E8]|uniref:CHASE3 domain-containing protein n=1 Tax=Leptospira sp. SA-E8 TaxID=3422259 RepID=UPI003EB8BAE8